MTTPTGPLTEQWLSDVLTELGQTADDVAAALRTAEITGERHNPHHCPIARYLAQRVRQVAPSGQLTVSVTTWTRVEVDQPDTGYHAVEVPTPEAVNDFITAFDTGAAYADLVAESNA